MSERSWGHDSKQHFGMKDFRVASRWHSTASRIDVWWVKNWTILAWMDDLRYTKEHCSGATAMAAPILVAFDFEETEFFWTLSTSARDTVDFSASQPRSCNRIRSRNATICVNAMWSSRRFASDKGGALHIARFQGFLWHSSK